MEAKAPRRWEKTKERLTRATEEHAQLAASFHRLVAENNHARARHALLAGCCDVLLEWFRRNGAADPAEEQLLLQELLQLPAVSPWPDVVAAGSATTAEAAAATDTQATATTGTTAASSSSAAAGASETSSAPEPLIAPEDDLLWVFKHLMSRPPFPGAQDTTLQQLVEFYSASCKELSLHSRMLQNPELSDEAAADILAQARSVILHLYHLLMTLMLDSNTTHIALALMTVNCATGEGPLEHSPQSFERALQHMALSPVQQERIACGCQVIKQMHFEQLTEAAELRQQLDSAAGIGMGIGIGMGPAGVGMGTLWGSASHMEQQDRVCRLRMVLKKQHFWEMVFSAFMLGSLTVRQAMEMYLSLYPCFAPINQVGARVTQLYQQRQQEEQAQEYQGRPPLPPGRRKPPATANKSRTPAQLVADAAAKGE